MSQNSSNDISNKDLNTKIEQLAEAVSSGFSSLEKRMDSLEVRMDRMEENVAGLRSDMSMMKKEIVYRQDFDDLAGRVKYIETKLEIESGK